MQNLIKGLLISLTLLAAVAIFYYLNGIQKLEELGGLFLLIPAFPIIGLILGFAAKKIQTKRFPKLLLLGLCLVYITSILLSTCFILMDDSKMIQDFEIFSSIFFLATTGFFIFGILIFPVLIAGIYILERWTRPTR